MIAEWIFWSAAALVVYVVIGYPLLLEAAARLRTRPIRKSSELRTVSILLPVRNGEPWIAAKLESILRLSYPRQLIEIIVVSDGSDDATDEIVRGFNGVELIRIPRSGKAAALNRAMERARGEILFFTDVRQQLDPQSLRNLVACFGDPEVGVASGELIIDGGAGGLYWRYEKWIRKNQSRVDSVPGATGCIYAMRRSLAAPLPPDALLDDVHLPLAAYFQGYRLVLEENARAFDYPTPLGSEFHRKVRTLAGNYQIIAAYPAVLGWVHFVSHKLGRLLLPFALITLAVYSYEYPVAWIPQALVYGLAALPLKRAAPARTFVVLMAASLCAVRILFAPAQSLWRATTVSAKAA